MKRPQKGASGKWQTAAARKDERAHRTVNLEAITGMVPGYIETSAACKEHASVFGVWMMSAVVEFAKLNRMDRMKTAQLVALQADIRKARSEIKDREILSEYMHDNENLRRLVIFSGEDNAFYETFLGILMLLTIDLKHITLGE